MMNVAIQDKVNNPLFSRSRMTFEQRALVFGETTFGCIGCGLYVTGACDGTCRDAGWRTVDNIDGPNHICPECVGLFDWNECLIEDGYENAAISIEQPDDTIPSYLKERFMKVMGITVPLEEGVMVGLEWVRPPCDWSHLMQRSF